MSPYLWPKWAIALSYVFKKTVSDLKKTQQKAYFKLPNTTSPQW